VPVWKLVTSQNECAVKGKTKITSLKIGCNLNRYIAKKDRLKK
jgi:hypothetical protein